MGYNSALKGLMKLEFSIQILEKESNIKFHENPSIGVELFHAGGRQTR
jgi:hypothetical protein